MRNWYSHTKTLFPQADGQQEAFTFVFQSEFMKAVLNEFGDVLQLDATHKTNFHGLPLFVLATNTTDGYKVSGIYYL